MLILDAYEAMANGTDVYDTYHNETGRIEAIDASDPAGETVIATVKTSDGYEFYVDVLDVEIVEGVGLVHTH
jgi:hypothetical protein